jgi:hypothetical protein
MPRDHYVFGYEAEPADERPTGFGQTNFGQSGLAGLSTVAAPWTASEHSTFDEPSRAIDRVHRLRQQRRQPYVVAALALLAVAIVACAVALAMRS